MIKFDVLNRFTGAVQFTAEIDCDEGESRAVKLGLAIQWALKSGANCRGANFEGANCRGASFEGADCRWASFEGANCRGASFEGANCRWANCRGANCRGANFEGASCRGANFEGVSLWGVSGVNDWIKCIQIEQYPIAYTSTHIQIGCQQHTIDEWREFDDRRIAEMDGKPAVSFWRKYKDWIFATIEMCPAREMIEKEGAA